MIVLEHLGHLIDPLASVGWLLSGIFARRWWQTALGAAVWSQTVYSLMFHYASAPDEQFDPAFAAGTALAYVVAALTIFGFKRLFERHKPEWF